MSSSLQQLVVPHTLREIMEDLHAGDIEGHLGMEKTVAKSNRSSIIKLSFNVCVTVSVVLQGNQHYKGIMGLADNRS